MSEIESPVYSSPAKAKRHALTVLYCLKAEKSMEELAN